MRSTKSTVTQLAYLQKSKDHKFICTANIFNWDDILATTKENHKSNTNNNTKYTYTTTQRTMMRLLPFILIRLLFLLSRGPISFRGAHRSSSSGGNQKRFESDNFYIVLGLNKIAKEKEIKSAYRKLALQYHPDKVKDVMDSEEAENIFIKVSDAYSVLSDEEKRKIYDQYGKNGLYAFEKGQHPSKPDG